MTSGVSATADAMIASAIGRAGQLATLPEIALEVMRVAEDPQATGDDLNRVLSHDPTLSARILKIVNSAYYGVRREVTSIGTAIGLLGFAAVKSIAIAASLTRMFRGGSVAGGFEARELWKHSIAVATAARALAPAVPGIEPNDAFLAGLMHDIGIIVELQACRDEFGAAITAMAADEDLSFLDAEALHIGATHEAFGKALCKAWRLPAALATVTGHHHRPLLLAEPEGRLTALIHIADHLAARAALGYSRTVHGTEIDPLVLERLGLTDADIESVSSVLVARVADVFPLLTGDG